MKNKNSFCIELILLSIWHLHGMFHNKIIQSFIVWRIELTFFSDITLHFWMGVLETKRERVGRGWAGRAAVNEEQMWISKEVHKSLAAFLTTQHASCLHPALPYVCVCFCYVTGWRSRFCPLTKQERLSVKRFLKVNK